MLETITNPDRINIGSINLEEPAPKWPPFDAERDFSKADWTLISDHLETLFWREFPVGFQGSHNLGTNDLSLWEQVFLKLLSPERYKGIVDSNIASSLIGGFAPVHDEGYFIRRSAIKLLLPEFREPVSLRDADDNTFEKIKIINDARFSYNKERLLTIATAIKVLSPKGYLAIDERDYQTAKDDYHPIRAGSVFKINLLFPDHAQEFNETVDWKMILACMTDELDKLREGKFSSGIEAYALDLKTLFSGGIKLTYDGIEFLPAPAKIKLSREIPSLPEVRKF